MSDLTITREKKKLLRVAKVSRAHVKHDLSDNKSTSSCEHIFFEKVRAGKDALEMKHKMTHV